MGGNGGKHTKRGKNGGKLKKFGGIGFFPISPHCSPLFPSSPHFSSPCGARWPPPNPNLTDKGFLGGFHTCFPHFPTQITKKKPSQPPFSPFPPISPHFPPFPHFSWGAFATAAPPLPHTALVANRNLNFWPKISHFPTKQSELPSFTPISPHFSYFGHFPDSVPLNVPKVGTSEPCRSALGGGGGVRWVEAPGGTGVMLSGPVPTGHWAWGQWHRGPFSQPPSPPSLAAVPGGGGGVSAWGVPYMPCLVRVGGDPNIHGSK